MASNEAVLVENAFSKVYYLHFIAIGISTFLNEHFQPVQFYLKPSTYDNNFVKPDPEVFGVTFTFSAL